MRYYFVIYDNIIFFIFQLYIEIFMAKIYNIGRATV